MLSTHRWPTTPRHNRPDLAIPGSIVLVAMNDIWNTILGFEVDPIAVDAD